MQGNSGKRDDIQKIILALLVSQKNAISLTHLDRDYLEQEGEHIPWKEFGYISLFDYLKSMPKYIHLERINGMYYVRGIATDKSKHVSSLVARQKESSKKPAYTRKAYRPSHYYPRTQRPRIHIPANILSDIIHIVREHPNGINKEYILRKVNEKLLYINISIMDLEEQFKDLSHELFIHGNLVFPTKSRGTCLSDQIVSPETLSKVEENLQSQHTTATPKYCVSGDSDSELNVDDDNDFSFVSPCNVLNGINENNKNTTSKKKQPISMFIQETVSKCHMQGDQCNDTFMQNIKENEYNNLENNETLHISTEKECQGDINYLDNESAKILINERTRFRLERLIEKYPNGIWCAELPEKYLQEYKISLNYIELGFNSVREFTSYLPEIFECKQLQPSGDFILYNAKNKLIDVKQKDRVKNQNIAEIYSQLYQEEDQIEALPVIVSSDISNKLMPEGVMVIGETVGQISVIDLENRLQLYIEVFVEEVFTPSLFWVQLRKKKKLFNKLMEDLHAFYQEKSELYKIPPVVLEKGLNCACIYNNQWHRGIIKTVKPDLQVTVMFYDYGTLKTYPPEAIYYLHRSFSYLPAQAIPCGLYNTKPRIGEQWSRGVTHEFALRTSQKPLIATIVSTDPENNSMLVTLTDTMEEEDVHINDWLVQQNLALHGKMVRIRPRNFPYYYYLECQKYHKTNSEDLSSSKTGIIKTDKRSILSKYLTKKSTPSDSHKSSNHVSSASVNSDSQNNFSSNDSKKDIELPQQSKSESIQSNNSKGPKELIRLFEKLASISKLSSTNYKTKSDNAQLHSDTKLMNEEKDEFKKELEKIDNSNNAISSMKSDNPLPIISPNSCYVETQPQKQETCSMKLDNIDYIEKKDINMCTQQKEQKQKNIPLPNTCFTNAVNLSTDSKSYYPYYDTLPDDNITTDNINDTSKIITTRKNKINLKNIKIGVPEEILSVLKSSTLETVNDSSSQVLSVIADSQLNISGNDKTVVPDVQKPSSIVEINEKENYKSDDGSAKSCNILQEECILTNKMPHHELTTNPIDSNGNSVPVYDNCSTNLQKAMHWLGIFKSLMKTNNTHSDNSKLDSDDLSNLENNDMNTAETSTEVLSNISNTSTDNTNEEMSNLICNTGINENSLAIVEYHSQSLLKKEDNCLEYMQSDTALVENKNKEVIPTFNDNDIESDDNEWDVVGDMYDFFGNSFLPNFKINRAVRNDDENGVQITEINDDENRLEITEINDNESFNMMKDIISNSEKHIDNLKSEITETKVIKNVQCTSTSNLECIEHSDMKETKKNCSIQQIQQDKAMHVETDTVQDNIVFTDVDNTCYKPQGKAKSLALMLHKLSKGNN
ncbi:hypothetical protein KPH14_006995 [Odynerus spinipes]|uniref:HTH OST-type domain-containing protein n=1 Tax=Odynerus spinipes TaxID=1348599 RepID=A0AAD9RSN5_9HYME|nr:hypothetical protein KPH14_006995 [Odynerus spinipes]